MVECRNCSEEYENTTGLDTNKEGWWCDGCDAYNYFDSINHANHQFTIIYEDKAKNEYLDRRSDVKFKQQLSPFRYAGGKSKLIPYLATFIREGKTDILASPFSGGASFELAMLERGLVKRLALNDLDYGVYAVWWVILNMPDELIYRISSFKPNREAFFEAQANIKANYYNLDLIDAAWSTLLVNRLAYSGILLANPLGGKKGDFETLTSRWNPATLIKRIKLIHSMADYISLSCMDAIEFIEDYFWSDTNTLFIDPPYFLKGQDLYPCAYEKRDHIKLSVVLDGLHSGTPAADILVTYDYHEYLTQLYEQPDSSLIIGRNYSI